MKKILYTTLTALMISALCTSLVQASENLVTQFATRIDAENAKQGNYWAEKIYQPKLVVMVNRARSFETNMHITTEIIQANKDIVFVGICQEDLAELKELYNITEMPDVVLIKDGKLKYVLTGQCLWTSSLQTLINTYLRS